MVVLLPIDETDESMHSSCCPDGAMTCYRIVLSANVRNKRAYEGTSADGLIFGFGPRAVGFRAGVRSLIDPVRQIQ